MRIVVLGAGGAASNGFTYALRAEAGRNYEIIGCNASVRDLALAQECDEMHLIPLAGAPGYIDAILDLKPDFVHAQNDDEVYFVSKHRAFLPTFLPSNWAIHLARDKFSTYARLQAAKVPVPKSVHFGRGFTVEDAFNNIEADELWFRRRIGAGGSGSFKTNDVRKAEDWIRINGNRLKDWMAAEAFGRATVTVQQLWYEGNLVVSQQRSRRSWANGRNTQTGVSGSTGVGETTGHADSNAVATMACKAISSSSSNEGTPHGLFGVDMVLDNDNKPRVTEINAGRFFTTNSEFFARAGFNMADVYVQYGIGNTNVFVPRLYNPLPNGLLWIRGMDTIPVLTDETELDRFSRDYIEAWA